MLRKFKLKQKNGFLINKNYIHYIQKLLKQVYLNYGNLVLIIFFCL